MARFAELNPQDRVFFAYDRALRRLGLPGIHIQAHLDMIGPIDVEGLKRTLLAIYRLYPAVGSRLDRHPVTGTPRWRLEVPPPDLDRVVRLHALDPPTEPEWIRQGEDLLHQPMDLVTLPPVQFHVFRGLPDGDRVVIRWPHAFMDVRGMILLAEDIDRIYREKPDLASIRPSGDEERRDFEALIAIPTLLDQVKLLARDRPRSKGIATHDQWLPAGRVRRPIGRIRHIRRFFSAEQTRQTQQAALRVCGFAQYGDFVRASALRAMHRAMPSPPPVGATYSTLNVLDHRKRRQRSPVCHNLFSGLLLRVPASMVEDRKAVAALLRHQTEQIVSGDGIRRHLALVKLISRLPPALLTEAMYQNMNPERESALPVAFGTPPSLQVGFSADAPTLLPTFCGANKAHTYGLGIPPPLSGFAIDLNLIHGQLHVTSTFLESRITPASMNRLMDDFAAALLDAS
ncbi:MAG TPA: hypothetical protein PKY77_04900 [Phycisphaerae bacterium]|nr:hypothetical protein [Phycisphaerae bacterium]HRY67199.1 hypothetical protein [Phycisphaerae bacterium]HSA26431.1 hypothetical protein [Phycisphaerae bacterium]